MLLRLAAATMALGLALPLAGCSKSADDEVAENAAQTLPVPAGMVRGTVLETMDSGGYTYVLMDTGEDQRWVASLQTPVQVGDVVQTDAGMAMTDFASTTLDRTFDVVYFVGLSGLILSTSPLRWSWISISWPPCRKRPTSVARVPS